MFCKFVFTLPSNRYEIVTGKSKFFEWQLDTERNIREFKEILESKNPPTFFNINDKMGFDPNLHDKITLAQNQLKMVMEEWLPDPSEFERVEWKKGTRRLWAFDSILDPGDGIG